MGKTMKHGRILLASILGWISSVPIAHADQAVIVIGGSATEHDRATVRAAAEAVTRNDGWSLQTKPLTKQEIESLRDCQDSSSPWTCVPTSLHASGTYHALILAVDNRQTEYGAPMVVVVGKVIATDTQAFAVKQRHCIQCADDKLGAAATDLTQELLRDIAVREGRTIVEVRSTPSGAQIILDGRPVQVTDASLNTYPGKHVVTLEKPGFQRETREITIARGKTADLAVVLQPSVATSSVHTLPHASRVVPGALIGIGATAVVAGVILYSIDEDPGPTGGKLYWDTAPTGVAIGTVGLATAGLGAYLWYRASRAQSPPGIVVLHHGALVAWRGSF